MIYFRAVAFSLLLSPVASQAQWQITMPPWESSTDAPSKWVRIPRPATDDEAYFNWGCESVEKGWQITAIGKYEFHLEKSAGTTLFKTLVKWPEKLSEPYFSKFRKLILASNPESRIIEQEFGTGYVGQRIKNGWILSANAGEFSPGTYWADAEIRQIRQIGMPLMFVIEDQQGTWVFMGSRHLGEFGEVAFLPGGQMTKKAPESHRLYGVPLTVLKIRDDLYVLSTDGLARISWRYFWSEKANQTPSFEVRPILYYDHLNWLGLQSIAVSGNNMMISTDHQLIHISNLDHDPYETWWAPRDCPALRKSDDGKCVCIPAVESESKQLPKLDPQP